MRDKSLKEMYVELKERPTPAALFLEEVASVSNRSVNAVRKWVTGEVQPDINTMIKLSQHFKVPYDILFPINDKNKSND